MQAGYVCCFADPNRAWNRSSPRQLGASVIAAAHIAQFQYIVKCVVGVSSDMWAVTKTHRGSAMTLDEKIDETATHVAPYVLSIARVVIALMLRNTRTFGDRMPLIAPCLTPPCQPSRGAGTAAIGLERVPLLIQVHCLDSRTTTAPVGSGSCGLRLVRVSSLQLARLTISPA